MEQRKFPFSLAVQEDKLLNYRELAEMIAKALNPGADESMSCIVSQIDIQKQLDHAVLHGKLVVRERSHMGPHSFPVGAALQDAVLMAHDIRAFLEARGIELRLSPEGNGPVYWNLRNAALAVAEQEGWHGGAKDSLLKEMEDAANSGHLKVRDPHSDLYKRGGKVRTFYELVTPTDVNTWLESRGAPYCWAVEMQSADNRQPLTVAPAESREVRSARVSPEGGDSLTSTIWTICYDLCDAGMKVTARPVMAELKRMATKMIHPLISTTAGGVKYEYERGDERELTSSLLDKRIQGWRKVGS